MSEESRSIWAQQKFRASEASYMVWDSACALTPGHVLMECWIEADEQPWPRVGADIWCRVDGEQAQTSRADQYVWSVLGFQEFRQEVVLSTYHIRKNIVYSAFTYLQSLY